MLIDHTYFPTFKNEMTSLISRLEAVYSDADLCDTVKNARMTDIIKSADF